MRAKPTPTDAELLFLLRAYIKTDTKPGTPEREAQEIAFDHVHWMVEDDAEATWRFLQLACREDLSEENMGFLAAGVLEDLLAYHCQAIFGRLEVASRRDERMRWMLAMVWRGLMDAATWEQVISLRSRLSIRPR
jgi:hypothetical protein